MPCESMNASPPLYSSLTKKKTQVSVGPPFLLPARSSASTAADVIMNDPSSVTKSVEKLVDDKIQKLENEVPVSGKGRHPRIPGSTGPRGRIHKGAKVTKVKTTATCMCDKSSYRHTDQGRRSMPAQTRPQKRNSRHGTVRSACRTH